MYCKVSTHRVLAQDALHEESIGHELIKSLGAGYPYILIHSNQVRMSVAIQIHNIML